MMFIDCRRYLSDRVIRLAVASIAYLDAVEGGCSVHLIGGETLRVSETVAEIEVATIGKDTPLVSSLPAGFNVARQKHLAKSKP